MRVTLLAVLALSALSGPGTAARGEESPPADSNASASTTATAAVTETAAAEPKPEEGEKFYLPPGFRERQRGKFTLYCRKETVMGSRFQTEKCYDKTGIRELVREMREEREKMDQIRKVCSSVGSCGGG